jgi:hypothetical protein
MAENGKYSASPVGVMGRVLQKSVQV